MAGRIPGPNGLNPPLAGDDIQTTRNAFPPPGIQIDDYPNNVNMARETEKKEILLDFSQLTLDITGIFDFTPFSDGTNTLISLSRGHWTNAAISALSILPFGDLAKVGKFRGYLRSIRKAIRLAVWDLKWGSALRQFFSK